MLSLRAQKQKILERLITLIDEGDPEVILAEEALVPKFNELLKHDLVVIKDDRVFLTEKGKLAKAHGFDYIVEQQKLPQKIVKKAFAVRIGARNYTVENLKTRMGSIYILALILLLTLVFLYLYNPIAVN